MKRRLPAAILLPILLLGVGCSPGDSGPDPEDAISRELFMETYFQLRAAALTNPGMEIRPDQRARILQELGVTEEDLFHFVEVWGSDPAYMEAIWDELEERMMRTREGAGEDGPGARGRMVTPDEPGDADPPPRPPGGPGRRGTGGPGERGGGS